MTFKTGLWGVQAKARSRKRVPYFSERVREYRRKIFDFYGATCKKCGFDNIKALQLDHVKGGGSVARLKGNAGTIYKDVINNPDKYQILCANCNWIKRYDNGETGKKVV